MWLRNTGLKKTVVLLVVAVEHRGNIRWCSVWLRNTGLKSKVGFYVVAKHCFLKCGGVAGGCTKLFRETMVMLGMVATHWFENKGGVSCDGETLALKLRWFCW